MLDIANTYVSEHSISFSTDVNPNKSKMKGMVFSRKKLNFSPAPLTLNGNSLPWVDSAKYLGNNITSVMDGMISDCKMKRAKFIQRTTVGFHG